MKTTKFFTKVDRRNKLEMVNFLENHFRYDTMSSWNNSTSWANNVKIYNVIPSELQDKAFQLMECDEFYYSLNDILENYAEDNNHYLQAGFNGRSSGYIVMYEGSVKTKTIFNFDNKNNDRDYADGYGWLSIEEAKEKGLYKKQIKQIGCYSDRSIDQNIDFSELEMYELKEIVEKVQSFDKMCDKVVEEVIYMCENNEVIEEEYTVTKTQKVLI